MESKFKIEIPKPCHEDWNAMTPDETGKFCSVCAKGVVDFTEMKATEIKAYFLKNQGQKICGRFKNEQVNGKFDFQIPQSVLNQQMSFHKAFLLTLFVVMGSTLFSCKNHDDATLGEVAVVNDTVEARTTKGMILPPKDSMPKTDTVKNFKQSHFITGDVSLPYDSIPKEKKEGKAFYTANEVEKLPSYPGGIGKLYDAFKSDFKVPEECKNVTGKIILSFVVDTDGSLVDMKILRGINETLDKEVIRFMKTSPKWISGEQNGKKVKVSYSLPIKITAE